MARSHLIAGVNIVTLLLVAVPIPVHSLLYKVIFDASKFMVPCKDNPHEIHQFFDFSKLNISLATESSMSLVGTLTAKEDYEDSPLSVHLTAKQKIRGRWVDSPYRSVIKDLCADYFKKGMWWYENVTQYFVGEERNCPPKKGLPLPLNATLALELNIPMRLPPGEYNARAVLKHKEKDVCMEFFVDLKESD